MMLGCQLVEPILNTSRMTFPCHMQLVRLLRSRLRMTTNSDAGREDGLIENIPPSNVNTQPSLEKRKSFSEKPAHSIEVTELMGNEPRTVKHPGRICGSDIAGAIRSQKKTHQSPSKVSKRPCWSKLDEVEISKYLRKHVIYADESLTIFNKPTGISTTGGDKVGTSFQSCLPILSKMVYGLNSSRPLILCNRLDKDSTGVLVCATNKDTSHKIIDLFRQQKIRRKYWAITVGAPNPSQGVLDIPMRMNHLEGNRQFRMHCKMVLAPQQKLDLETGQMVNVRQRNSETAVTHFRTLDSYSGLALVEVQPFSSAKHQIRVHLSEALSCCILGDHKYSQPAKLAPQRLPSPVLHRFGLKQTKSRNIPMHLHLREVILPGVLDGDKPNLLISAKAPEHFYQTMKLFKLKPGKETDFVYPENMNLKRTPKRNNPLMEEMYVDPFGPVNTENSEVQRQDCFAVYKPKVRVRFQYTDS